MCLAGSISENISHSRTCSVWKLILLCYHACSLVGIHVCLVMRDFGNMIFCIGYWTCVSGVIHIISTCKTVFYIVKSLYLVGVDHLHVFYSSVSSLAESSLDSPAAHGFILVWWFYVLVCYIGGVTKMDRLMASYLGSVLYYLPW